MHRRDVLRHLSYLSGVAVTAPSLLIALQSCGRDEPDLDWSPQYFTDSEARFVTSYVDTLLPRTPDSYRGPGGLDVGVPAFIDRVMAATAGEGDKPSPLQTGILEFDEGARTQYGMPFHQLDATQRGELFTAAEGVAPRYNPQVWGTAVGEQPPVGFYRSLKSMALWGYLSSEKIGTEVLHYDPVPGGYDGCVDLASLGGRAWSL